MKKIVFIMALLAGFCFLAEEAVGQQAKTQKVKLDKVERTGSNTLKSAKVTKVTPDNVVQPNANGTDATSTKSKVNKVLNTNTSNSGQITKVSAESAAVSPNANGTRPTSTKAKAKVNKITNVNAKASDKQYVDMTSLEKHVDMQTTITNFRGNAQGKKLNGKKRQ